MCILIVTKPGALVDDPTLARCAARNRDGGGFAYVDKDSGKVVIKKGFMQVSDFIKSYHETLEAGHGEKNAMMLHFRIATLGAITKDNCHPFIVPNGAMGHNGSLWMGGGGSGLSVEKSDTREFAERISINLTPEVLRKVQPMLSEAVSYNKLAFLFDGGEYVIINEDDGAWAGDVWYSNSTYKDYGQSYRSSSQSAFDNMVAGAACEIPDRYLH